MSIWIPIILAGLINYLTRLGSILIINPNKMNATTKQILNYVPSAVFPAIIFPSVFLDQDSNIIHFTDPKIIAFSVAFLVGIFTKNLIVTIFSGLLTFWFIIFFIT